MSDFKIMETFCQTTEQINSIQDIFSFSLSLYIYMYIFFLLICITIKLFIVEIIVAYKLQVLYYLTT